MSFEQLVRPFAARPVTTTSKIVSPVIAPTVQTAILSWGVAGDIPPGVKQEPGADFGIVGFNMKQKKEEWVQDGEPTTEEKRITQRLPDGTEVPQNFVDVARVREIKFRARDIADAPSNSAGHAVPPDSPAGLTASVPGTASVSARYKMNWGE